MTTLLCHGLVTLSMAPPRSKPLAQRFWLPDVSDREDMRLALIIEVKAIGVRYVSDSFDWLDFPKSQMRALIHMALEVYFT